MSKYNKATYCKNCGASNSWALNRKSSLLEKPKLCNSCGSNLITRKIAKKRKEESKEIEEIEEDADIVISTDIPPLELDEGNCYFPTLDSQTIGNLVAPPFKEEEEGN